MLKGFCILGYFRKCRCVEVEIAVHKTGWQASSHQWVLSMKTLAVRIRQCFDTKDPLVTMPIPVDCSVCLIQYCNGKHWMRCHPPFQHTLVEEGSGWMIYVVRHEITEFQVAMEKNIRLSLPITNSWSAWCSEIELVLIIRSYVIPEIFGVQILFLDPTVFVFGTQWLSSQIAEDGCILGNSS